ncbi:bifunctional demethylmenaquinone methyltransferase/2-methoxy-6-polyprenyl-1,4-benzoquinol methylase [Halobacillus halophilus]|uniref:Demethylmenaquinone methyltransferase n=1 Tax=Halobacillus halophilus (strain ATCC 35676 / DSM 2266 / JCM 20832 / KCTC 3685 / LMG 17431 / NBRC 102448 / NCIMB 2269) TaxID=866895 RepID=I0JNA9_HALH3|nr:demethylmenaquinone methyltransferase [Halobacillus halophilus]ASF39691.1 bifunctional demethylmenaquinone methyltransferase/2-methoxy-6-polyprenyl-1,4-benzoquinol methylase [Halobacillus halophilus]CCG45629.1 ubiquinone/menaquinone biosynthesis methyltransferase [Halobacillus halophilus DSM 2266]
MGSQTKEERVHHVFEQIYNRYDQMNSIISFQQHRLWRRDVMKRMNVSKGDRTLDLCCGTGDWTMTLAKEVGPTGKVVGLDFSVNMLSVAIKKKMALKMKQVEFEHGNAMELPFEDDQFDYVTIGFGLRNVPDYRQVLSEMLRVVKPGGKVVCLETSQPENPVFKSIYYFYFRNIMPLFGKLFAKSYQEYSWLHESAKDFPGKNELKELFEDIGFKNVIVKSYTGGVAAMHMGEKQ